MRDPGWRGGVAISIFQGSSVGAETRAGEGYVVIGGGVGGSNVAAAAAAWWWCADAALCA